MSPGWVQTQGLGLRLWPTGLGLGLGLWSTGLGLGLGLWSNGLGLTPDGLGLWPDGLGLGLGLWSCGLGLTAGLTSPDSLQHCPLSTKKWQLEHKNDKTKWQRNVCIHYGILLYQRIIAHLLIVMIKKWTWLFASKVLCHSTQLPDLPDRALPVLNWMNWSQHKTNGALSIQQRDQVTTARGKHFAGE